MKLYNYDFAKRYLNISLTTLRRRLKKEKIVSVFKNGVNYLTLESINQLNIPRFEIIESRMNYDFETFESKINLN